MFTKRKSILLSSGMAAVFFYVLHVVLGGFLWENYSHIHQPISDLTATGAPNRRLMLFLTTLYGCLALFFAVSFTVLESKKHHRLVFWGGLCFIILHIVSLSYSLFPEDLPGQKTFAGTMHIAVTALIVPFTIVTPFLIGIGLLKEPAWKEAGRFSILAGILILVFGTASGVFYTNRLPYFGLVERFNIGTLQVWTFYLSFKFTVAK